MLTRELPAWYPPLRTLVPVLALLLSLTGCATLPSGAKPDPRDRFERLNRSIYLFNVKVDHAVLRPAARAYVKITPRPVRTGVSNFMSNLTYTTTIINDFLQGQWRDGASDTTRIVVNTLLDRKRTRLNPCADRRPGVANFMSNLTYTTTIITDFLQGQGRDGASDTTRIVVNTL